MSCHLYFNLTCDPTLHFDEYVDKWLGKYLCFGEFLCACMKVVKTYIRSGHISRMEFFCSNSERIFTVHYFPIKVHDDLMRLY